MSRIKELPKSTSHLLSCTQVITSIQSVVKELLENALDSHATSIEIKLDNFGLEKIEVKDNGDGIIKDDIHFVAKPHCTSKITSHLDLVKISTYGFRGEALSAISAVADLAITTKTADEEFGYTYTFDHNGNILSSKPCPCNQGTSVVVTNLFNNVPVRKQLYRSEKKKKEELRMIEDVLIAFGCISTKIRIVLHHNRNLIWQKSVVDRVIDGLRLALGDAADYMENCEYVDEETQIKIETFLPKRNAPPSCSQTSSNRSIVAINKRPVRMKSIDKLLKEYYCKSLGDGHKSRYPVCFISIDVPPTDIDVNFEPNKTAVLLHNMDIIKEQLSKLLNSFYNNEVNVETNSLTKSDTNIIFPVSAQDEITKLINIHNASSILDKENGTHTFHSNQSLVTNGLQNNNKPKENLVSSKKLSRKNDFHSPSNKKVKYSTPPNDLHRHINTLDSFFSSENKSSEDANTISNNSCVNELQTEKTHGNGMNSENSSTSDESRFPDPNSMIVTVQRKNVGETLSLDPFEKPLDKNTTGTSAENRYLLSNCSKMGQDSRSYMSIASNSNQTESLRLDEVNKGTFVSALSIINQEKNQKLQSDETNKNLTTFDERPLEMQRSKSKRPLEVQRSKSNLESETCDPLTAGDWSRGLHPAENIQPVAVLKPNVVGTDASCNEAKSSAQEIDIQEPCVVSTIQRKITPFDFFCREHRLEVASLNPELNNQQIAQILSEKWSRLSSEEKAAYKNIVSKDYPKNIKNKNELGKIIRENINKMKNSSENSKKSVKKKRRRRIEKDITFDMQLLQESDLNPGLGDEHGESFKVVSCLAPGIWICRQGNKLHLLNCYRLQEAVIYFRLLDTYVFETEPIESSIILTSSLLGNDAMDVLLQMETVSEYGCEYISDNRLTANGFKMKILQGNDETQVQLVGMTNSMAFYGGPDLKEILLLIKEKGFDAKLADCRPEKAVLYLQGEAVRIARQNPASKKTEDIEDLLKQVDSLPSKTCLHSRPFLHDLYELNNTECQ